MDRVVEVGLRDGRRLQQVLVHAQHQNNISQRPLLRWPSEC